MRILKIILQSNIFYITIILFLSLYIFIFTVVVKYESKYSISDNNISGIVKSFHQEDDKISITLLGKEKVILNYYTDISYDNLLGKKISVTGKFKDVYNNTIPNTFNYKKYLYNNKIYYTFTVSSIEVLDSKIDIISKVKVSLNNYLNNLKESSYLKLFILGNKSFLEDSIYKVYQDNGVAHLLAISGLHISLFVMILEFILRRLNKKIKYTVIIFYLFIYLILTSFLVSILRCVIYYILKVLLSYFNINISSIKKLLLTAFILLFINPFYLYSISFIYSFIITFFLLILKYKNNYIKNLLIISSISFLASVPITSLINYEINISSILFNIVLVPYISFIVYPVSLLTLVFPFIDNIFIILINIFETLNNIFYNYLSINIIIPKLPVILVIIYYILLIIFLKYKKRLLFINVLILFIPYIFLKLDNNYYVYYLDIGQGDSTLLISPYQKEVILIDTGGSLYYSVSDNTLTLLRSLGINKIDILVLSHGDLDHIYDGVNIINNIRVDDIIINNNDINDYEKDILDYDINILDNINLEYFKSNNLNTHISSDENDSSIVNYFKLYDYNFLFTGDIGKEDMYNILKNYNLDVDFLKISHHGSKNNTDQYIINKINPIYSFISAGRNNLYNHPHYEVTNILSNYYLTSKDGTIRVKLNKKGFNIKTFKP